MNTRFLLTACLGLIATTTLLGMQDKDWYVVLGKVKNKSDGTATVTIRRPGAEFKDTEIVRPHKEQGFTTKRWVSSMPTSDITKKLPLKTAIDITIEGGNKAVQRGLLAEKRNFENKDVIDVTIHKDYKITYKTRRWCEERKCWCSIPEPESHPSELITV